jgi:hypothetical protein
VTFTPGDEGAFDVRAVDAGGVVTTGAFRVPLSKDELQRAVLGVARDNSRKATVGRDVGSETAPIINAEQLGAALAGALLAGEVGVAYDTAQRTAEAAGRGLRLSLSLAGAPALLSVPWEFLYRRPRFLASQRHTPLVRLLDTGSSTPTPSIQSEVRILGVIASPASLSPLDVVAERRRVERALTKVRELGRVQLDWLDPTTPRRLREALRDGSYHVLHYVGHSDFTDNGDGLLYLEDGTGGAVPVDSTALANLLSDQTMLRLVVLNSCEGARTTLTDPYAGVATTLVQLGVPAVVAMQFEISDTAAIVFAEELYTNLIGRQDPIDAAVAEARKAIYIEVDKIEWATPVLFVRDPEVELFNFRVPVAPLPPPPPPEMPTERPPRASPDESTAAQRRMRGRRRLVVSAMAGVGVLAGAAGLTFAVLAGDDEGSTETTVAATDDTISSGTPAQVAEATAPRPRTGFLAVQVLEPDGESHINTINPDSGRIGVATDRPGAIDTQAVWDRNTNRMAFTRERPADGSGRRVSYVVPGNGRGEDGRQVAPLIPWKVGEVEHFPAWAPDGSLYYMRTGGCTPGPRCAEELRRATFTTADDGEGFLDALTVATDEAAASGLAAVSAVAADPDDAGRVAVADAQGLSIVEFNDGVSVAQPATAFTALAYTPDGEFLLAATPGASARDSFLHVFSPDGTRLNIIALLDLIGGADNSPRVEELTPDDVILSLTPAEDGNRVLALVPDTIVELSVDATGGLAISAIVELPDLSGLGDPRAIAL